MFTLHIDATLYFVPLMVDDGNGICVTREFQLPFPPSEDVALSGIALNGQAMALGYKLTDITWDIDRETFFAKTSSSFAGFPMATIPLELRSWVDRGWRLGRYEATYEKEDRRATRYDRKPIRCTWNWDEEEAAAEWERMKPRNRPVAFNKLFDAIIREMAVLDNNCAVAYAMRHTHIYVEGRELETAATEESRKFKVAKLEYEGKSFDAQYSWRQNVVRKCPHLSQFVASPPRRTQR